MVKVALFGNPNTGKSSVFNLLTGLRQRVGNFPGITVDKKQGQFDVEGERFQLIDFPGTYSIYPRSEDEKVVFDSLMHASSEDYPDAILFVADASNLERNLLFFSQIYDLQLPIVLVLNMMDLVAKNKKIIDVEQLSALFPEATIVQTNARIKAGKSEILEALTHLKPRNGDQFLESWTFTSLNSVEAQEEETAMRFDKIRRVPLVHNMADEPMSFSNKLDRILVHPVFGYLIFSSVLLLIFQFIYSFANVPMDWIDASFSSLSSWLSQELPEGILTDLITEGIIPGIGGVVVFIPQIALLFFFITVLEESGYLSRVVFIMDRIMRPLGLNGKSVVPLISSVACAIPGVMAARTIADKKERIITIMVAPLMSCSARIPVYTVLIALVIPDTRVGGVLNAQGLVLFGLYAMGVVSALLVAFVLKKLIRTKEKGFLLLEMPSYKLPNWGNVGLEIWGKVRVFVWDAGRIILAISIILWALGSYGPTDRMANAQIFAEQRAAFEGLNAEETEQLVNSMKLENSYIGIMGKTVEPLIAPLGYDWKIGISLITSFAAREVFVGSMATIYAVQDNDEKNVPLKEKMKNEKRADGTPLYSLATGLSLMVFYVFAMQCMATLAVVKRETNSWKWPLMQLAYMGTLAYLGAWITFNLMHS